MSNAGNMTLSFSRGDELCMPSPALRVRRCRVAGLRTYRHNHLVPVQKHTSSSQLFVVVEIPLLRTIFHHASIRNVNSRFSTDTTSAYSSPLPRPDHLGLGPSAPWRLSFLFTAARQFRTCTGFPLRSLHSMVQENHSTLYSVCRETTQHKKLHSPPPRPDASVCNRQQAASRA